MQPLSHWDVAEVWLRLASWQSSKRYCGISYLSSKNEELSTSSGEGGVADDRDNDGRHVGWLDSRQQLLIMRGDGPFFESNVEKICLAQRGGPFSGDEEVTISYIMLSRVKSFFHFSHILRADFCTFSSNPFSTLWQPTFPERSASYSENIFLTSLRHIHRQNMTSS